MAREDASHGVPIGIECLGRWSHPLLAGDARAPREAPLPIEVLACRMYEASRAWRGARGLVWLDTGGGPDGAGEGTLTAFPRAIRRWHGASDGTLSSFLDGLVEQDGVAGVDPDALVDPDGLAVPEGAPRFRGGWLGHLCYEAVAALEPVETFARRDQDVPIASWALHDIWFRHVPAESRLELWARTDRDGSDVRRPDVAAWVHWAEDALRAPGDNTMPMWAPPEALRRRAPSNPCPVDRLVSRAERSLTRDAFESGVRMVQAAIREGEVFQANIAQRFRLPIDGDAFEVFLAVRRLNPSPFACFVQEDWGALVSNSPERLFSLARDGGRLRLAARPIAGTRPRHADPVRNASLVRELQASVKERAEHTMLVDLARNDVGRVSAPGSVRVREFQTVEAYSHVHHLVSDVEGVVGAERRFHDVVRAMFPGGTITGAPKLRSVEVIDRVEPVARGPYTGAFGYVNPDGSADWNILIRTLTWHGGGADLYVGAGIVADSDPGAEYDETLHKAAAMLEAVAAVADVRTDAARRRSSDGVTMGPVGLT